MARPTRRRAAGQGCARGPGGLAGPGPGRPDGGLAVRVPPRRRRDHGRRLRRTCRPPASRRSICGDAHLGNFGFYASPERDLVFDLNDFDEAHPGAWEWDLRRLVASVWVAGRQNGSTEDAVRGRGRPLRRGLPQPRALAGRAAAAGPRLRAARRRPAAAAPPDDDPAAGDRAGRAPRPHADQRPGAAAVHRAARRRPPDRRGPAADHPGRRRATPDCSPRASTTTCARCRPSGAGCSAATRWSTSRTRWSASARSGCAPTSRCCEGSSPDDVLFLQLKQARRSVVAPFVHGDSGLARPPGPAGGGVPAGAADRQRPAARLDHRRRPAVLRPPVPRHEGRHRRRRPRRRARWPTTPGSAGRLLAKGHARTSGASMIAGYVGARDKLDARAVPVRAGLRRPDRTATTTACVAACRPRRASLRAGDREPPRSSTHQGSVASSARPVR